MGDNEGDWIKLYRKITDSKVWYYTHGQYRVWTTILLSVNWGETWGRFDGEEIKVKPGEMITSIEHLSDESMTSKNIVRKTLDKLEKDDMIETDRTNKGTHLKVLNWSKYQQNGERGNTQGDPQADTQDDPQTDAQGEDTIRKKKEGQEQEEDKSADTPDETIDIDWLLDEWAKHQPHDPSQSERQAQQNYVKYFDGYERQEVKEAMQGMNELFEYEESGWGLKDLNNKFSKARGAFSENGDGSGDEPVLSYHQPYKPEEN
jgi:hypothetical protein